MVTALLTLANTVLLIGGLAWIVLVWRKHLTVLNDRTQARVEELIESNETLLEAVTVGIEATDRNWAGAENDRKVVADVAADLANAKEAVAGVAADLLAGRRAAASVHDGVPGEAADAAVTIDQREG